MSEEDVGTSSAARGGAYYPAPDELDPNVPINLNSLRDAPPDGKPLYSYATLIRYAIKGSPEGRLLLEEIYYAIEQRYPYFKTAPAGWKNSVRHNLSLNSCFQKVPRPLTDRGKGSYWKVDDSVDPKQGIHRVRSRRRKTKLTSDGTSSPVPYGYPYGVPEGSYDSYAAMYPYGYDPSMFPPPFMNGAVGTSGMSGGSVGHDLNGAPMPFSDPNLATASEHHPPGHDSVDWRGMYLAELDRLKNMTKEQDKDEAPQEWYRMMTMRLRMGMLGLPPFPFPVDQGGGGSASGGGGSHGVGSHSQHHHHHAQQDHDHEHEHDMMDDSGIMEEEEED
ncbi:hypothetical protein CPB86DRAFT_273735 [Serendipita vermifera]|nr:hypothetical protein CPB86DRAFT_273735 [Serendipita vermifera]